MSYCLVFLGSISTNTFILAISVSVSELLQAVNMRISTHRTLLVEVLAQSGISLYPARAKFCLSKYKYKQVSKIFLF